MKVTHTRLLCSSPLIFFVFLSCLVPSVSWSAIIGKSSTVPANAVSNTNATLALPTDFTIGQINLMATFSPGTNSIGDAVPLQAGDVWLTLTRLAQPGTSELNVSITLFDFPVTYPSVPTDPACSSGGSFDSSCITTELNGSYLFDDSATQDFDSLTLASIDGILAPDAYHSSIDSLDRLVGQQANATYRISTGSVRSRTYGNLDWQLELTAVPVPASIWLFISGLTGLAGFANHKKTLKNRHH